MQAMVLQRTSLFLARPAGSDITRCFQRQITFASIFGLAKLTNACQPLKTVHNSFMDCHVRTGDCAAMAGHDVRAWNAMKAGQT